MSGPSSNCPNCGAPIKFAWSSAVQAACPYCQAIIVRRDVNLEAVGVVADLPPDASAIQLMSEGFFDNKHFIVIGRIRYEWEQGNWNEWHLLFNDGTNGWLSDAQADYAVSFAVAPPIAFPTPLELKKGQVFQLQGGQFMVTHLTKVRYVGFEGELPFTTTDRSEFMTADLRTMDARFATIDYSETPPLLFMGRYVDIEALKLTGLREFEGW
ncbi:DUF4178 domain-containing protein [Paludibaculum fermentans]|uniref:DUF4178 domain-containing protein n=1 Tax=Paludibaculum fermentans TaxID=1473598 RepID=UPI003EB6CA65